ncbi:unnamed protein product [Rotaria sp. Silwood2]|nr:unnamed protein product [Rotaria sp. Silwood2]
MYSLRRKPSIKLNEELNGMAKLNELLERLASKQYELKEQFINVKNNQNENVRYNIGQLTVSNHEAKETILNSTKLIRDLILPTLELISKYLYHSNMNANGVDDADFKHQIETKRTLVDLILTSKKVFI